MENRRFPKQNSQTRCKRHPKHQQSPGVCSVCLRERLSQISSSSRGNTTSMVMDSSNYSSSSSSLSSLSSSSELSPVHRHRASGAKWSKSVLGKSRSMAAFVDHELGREGKKKRGFWSKLIRSRSNNKKGTIMHGADGDNLVALVHSRTMRERVISATRFR